MHLRINVPSQGKYDPRRRRCPLSAAPAILHFLSSLGWPPGPRRGWNCSARHLPQGMPLPSIPYPESPRLPLPPTGRMPSLLCRFKHGSRRRWWFLGYHAAPNPVYTGRRSGSAPAHTMAIGAPQIRTPPPQCIWSASTQQPIFEERVAADVASVHI